MSPGSDPASQGGRGLCETKPAPSPLRLLGNWLLGEDVTFLSLLQLLESANSTQRFTLTAWQLELRAVLTNFFDY